MGAQVYCFQTIHKEDLIRYMQLVLTLISSAVTYILYKLVVVVLMCIAKKVLISNRGVCIAVIVFFACLFSQMDRNVDLVGTVGRQLRKRHHTCTKEAIPFEAELCLGFFAKACLPCECVVRLAVVGASFAFPAKRLGVEAACRSSPSALSAIGMVVSYALSCRVACQNHASLHCFTVTTTVIPWGPTRLCSARGSLDLSRRYGAASLCTSSTCIRLFALQATLLTQTHTLRWTVSEI